MSVPESHEVTELLVAWSDGDEQALERLAPLVQAELHRLARRYMSRERGDHLLQTSALINEAYLRLIDWKSARWQNRAHFYGVAAQMMRRILVDFARRRPRGAEGEARHVSLEVALVVADVRQPDLVLLKALEKDRELRYQTASDLRADLKRLGREIDSAPSQNVSGRKGSGIRRAAARARTRATPLLFIVGLLLVFLAAFAGWSYMKSRGDAPDWSRATHLQLTDEAGTEFFPSLAPDGRTFVYSSDQAGNFDLYLQRVGGKNPTNLTKDSAADDTQPAFSPDGNHIAFRSAREPAGVYVMGATGENLRLVAAGGFHPSWAPDGREIAYSLKGRNEPDVRNTVPSQIWVVNVESGAKRLLCEMDAMQPAWSPHGARVAFWFMPASVGRSDVATVPSAGGEPVVVTNDATTNWNPVWSPDGTRLLYRTENTNNFILDLNKPWDAQTPEQLPPPPTPGELFVVWDWSPDGRKLCGRFEGKNGMGIGYYSFETGRYEKVSDIHALPSWLPDSRHLVFAHEGKAYIADTVTKKVREIYARPSEQVRSVGVSRDGRLLYYTLLSTESDVWLLNLE